MDIVKPLIVLYYRLCKGHTDNVIELTLAALKLWAEAFNATTKVRRKNRLRVSHSKYLDLLKQSEKFVPSEGSLLFGQSFIDFLHKEDVKAKEASSTWQSAQQGTRNASQTGGGRNHFQGAGAFRGMGAAFRPIPSRGSPRGSRGAGS